MIVHTGMIATESRSHMYTSWLHVYVSNETEFHIMHSDQRNERIYNGKCTMRNKRECDYKHETAKEGNKKSRREGGYYGVASTRIKHRLEEENECPETSGRWCQIASVEQCLLNNKCSEWPRSIATAHPTSGPSLA